jgi:hypothetical protein
VLRWAADTAAGWKACTKKLSAISCQLELDQKPRSRERGFLSCARNARVGPRPNNDKERAMWISATPDRNGSESRGRKNFAGRCPILE